MARMRNLRRRAVVGPEGDHCAPWGWESHPGPARQKGKGPEPLGSQDRFSERGRVSRGYSRAQRSQQGRPRKNGSCPTMRVVGVAGWGSIKKYDGSSLVWEHKLLCQAGEHQPLLTNKPRTSLPELEAGGLPTPVCFRKPEGQAGAALEKSGSS